MSSQSSTVPGWASPPGQEERSRWWLVIHRVPFTAGSPVQDSSTLSTVAVLISSENSMAVPVAAKPRRSLPWPGRGRAAAAGLEGERGNPAAVRPSLETPPFPLRHSGPDGLTPPLRVYVVTYSVWSFLTAKRGAA